MRQIVFGLFLVFSISLHAQQVTIPPGQAPVSSIEGVVSLRGNGVPTATCSSVKNVGVIYVQTDAAAPDSSLYVCGKMASGVYTWEGPFTTFMPSNARVIGFTPFVTDQGPLPYAPTLPASALYASPSGSGTTCSVGSPCSITTAKTTAAGGGVKNVVLRGGTYTLAANLAFTISDLGESWQNYPGEVPVLDGATNAFNVTVTNLTGAAGLSIQGITFQNMAPYSISTSGSDHMTIRWNRFLNCNRGCVEGSGVSNSLIDSNIMNGQSPGQFGGGDQFMVILFFGSSNTTVSHNWGLNAQGGFISITNGSGDPTESNDIIDRNIIQNVNTNTVDSGAIYIADLKHNATGFVVTNNYIDGSAGTNYLVNITKAIYLDDEISGVVVTGNFARTCGAWCWELHGGSNDTIQNNFFDVTLASSQVGLYQSSSIFDTGMTGNVITQNVIYSSAAMPSSLYQVTLTGGDVLPSNSSGSMYFSATNASIPNTNLVDSSPTIGNPGIQSFVPYFLLGNANAKVVPTSCAGLVTGALFNNSGTAAFCP